MAALGLLTALPSHAPVLNASETAREVILLKATTYSLEEENAKLERDVSRLSERLALLESTYHGHDLWEWAGTFEVAAGEFDWTFVGRLGDGVSGGHYIGGAEWIDVVLLLGVSDALEVLRPRAELLLSLPCEPVFGSTLRPAPRIRPTPAGVCFRLYFDASRDHTTFVVDCPLSGRLALFAQHDLAELDATRLLQLSTRGITSPVANISCCGDDAGRHDAAATGGLWGAQPAAEAPLSRLGALVALPLSGTALLLSVVALVCARSHACGKPGSARGRAPWRVISPSERQRPLEVALPMGRTAPSAEEGTAPEEGESTELQAITKSNS